MFLNHLDQFNNSLFHTLKGNRITNSVARVFAFSNILNYRKSEHFCSNPQPHYPSQRLRKKLKKLFTRPFHTPASVHFEWDCFLQKKTWYAKSLSLCFVCEFSTNVIRDTLGLLKHVCPVDLWLNTDFWRGREGEGREAKGWWVFEEKCCEEGWFKRLKREWDSYALLKYSGSLFET